MDATRFIHGPINPISYSSSLLKQLLASSVMHPSTIIAPLEYEMFPKSKIMEKQVKNEASWSRRKGLLFALSSVIGETQINLLKQTMYACILLLYDVVKYDS